MDLNELLHAHQIAVMKAGAGANDEHFGRIAEYADRIRRLRTMAHADAVPVAQVPLAPGAPPTIIYGSYGWDSRKVDDGAQQQNENPDRGKADT